ncbi:hypothetical protein BJX70DRAFT_96987 [Aspergillus crustosus]
MYLFIDHSPIRMETTSDTSLLSREVERLVTAPYVPSLQSLDSLTQQAPSTLVLSWASQKPCHIGALVDVLVDGLSRSRYALPLLARFARIQDFRDDLLHRHPYLLDQFLQRSIEDEETECLSACLSILSFPLPGSVIPPASLAVFVMQMIEKLRMNPCADTVRPLYLVSSCLQSSGVLFELPLDLMSCFQSELTKTLRNLDDHMGNLMCLATFARIAFTERGYSKADKGLSMPSWLQNTKHFFGQKRGLKTLDLVVLRVILACSSSCGNLTDEQAGESIRLAIEICDSVGNGQRENWIESNSVKLTKLVEKISRDGIDHGVQILGVSFLVSLIPTASLPPNLPRQSLEWLSSDDAAAALEVLPVHIIPRLVQAYIAFSQTTALDKLLAYVCSALSTSANNTTDLTKLHHSKLILEGLRSSRLLNVDANFKYYGDVIHKLMNNFPRLPCHSECGGASVCYVSATKLENELLSNLLTIWLEATLSQNMQDPSSSSEVLAIVQLMTQNKKALPNMQCTMSMSEPLSLRYSFPQSPPKLRETAQISRGDWKTGMREVLVANSRSLNESIMQNVERICYELEQRCGGIEAPLRLAEEERSKYQLEAEQLRAQNNEVECRLQQATSTILGLHEEISRLERRTTSANDHAKKLSTSLSESLRELEEQQRSSQNTLSRERETFRTRELDMIASITEKDDRLDALQENIKRQSEEIENLLTTLASNSRNKDLHLQTISDLKGEIIICQTETEKSKTSLLQKDERIGELMTRQESADKTISDLQYKLHKEMSKTEELETDFHGATQRLQVELEEQQKESQLQYSRMTHEATERQAEIVSLERAMHEWTVNATKELQTKENRIQDLEKKVRQLRDERAAKAREFSEAQQHISRLIGVMGFTTASSANKSFIKHRSQPSVEQTRALPRQTQKDRGNSIAHSQEVDPSSTSAEITTPHSNGRSPKRSRNGAFPLAQPSPPRSCDSIKRARESAIQGDTRARKGRKPLEDADKNSQMSSHDTERLSYSHRGDFQDSQLPPAEQNHLDDIDLDLDLEFSKDFVFTSTSLSELNGHTMA